MKIPLRPLAVLGVLLQVLLVLNFFGFNVVPFVARLEELVFLSGCALVFYSFLAWLSGLRASVSDNKRMRDYVAWLTRGGENKK